MENTWSKPKDDHIVYEALSAIADNRFELMDKANAKCISTSKGKYYSIQYDKTSNSMMSNDNMAYYRGEVSYPMVAMLLAIGSFDYDKTILEALKGIPWKDINQKNKNDYMKSVEEVLKDLAKKGIYIEKIKIEVQRIFDWVMGLKLRYLGDKVVPPNAY